MLSPSRARARCQAAVHRDRAPPYSCCRHLQQVYSYDCCSRYARGDVRPGQGVNRPTWPAVVLCECPFDGPGVYKLPLVNARPLTSHSLPGCCRRFDCCKSTLLCGLFGSIADLLLLRRRSVGELSGSGRTCCRMLQDANVRCLAGYGAASTAARAPSTNLQHESTARIYSTNLQHESTARIYSSVPPSLLHLCTCRGRVAGCDMLRDTRSGRWRSKRGAFRCYQI
jgi:hypothetical protein